MHRAIHHQCIHCIKWINFVHSVLPFIISASSVHLSMHHQCIHQCIHHCIIKVIHQCIINASLIHYQCLHQLESSIHCQCICQCIINAFINAFSDQYTINASSLHQMHQFFLSFIKFIQISSFALLFVHSLLCCCHSFRLSSFLFKFTLPVQFIFHAFIPSFAVRSCIHLIYYYIISAPR